MEPFELPFATTFYTAPIHKGDCIQLDLHLKEQALLPSNKYTETLKLAGDLRMQSGRPLPQHRTCTVRRTEYAQCMRIR